MPLIECLNLKKDYFLGKTTFRALDEINLKIQKGEFTSIAGPSGSGKTTLLNLIGALDKPSTGEILIEGIGLSNLSQLQLSNFRKSHIGFIFQTFNLIPVLTAYENVELALVLMEHITKEEIHNKVNSILDEVGLSEFKNRKPNELSGGQQQRVAIARALVKEPKLILADEPTANLDQETGENLLKLMLELNQKKDITFIFSTHDKMVMDYAKRLIILRDGKITEDNIRYSETN